MEKINIEELTKAFETTNIMSDSSPNINVVENVPHIEPEIDVVKIPLPKVQHHIPTIQPISHSINHPIRQTATQTPQLQPFPPQPFQPQVNQIVKKKFSPKLTDAFFKIANQNIPKSSVYLFIVLVAISIALYYGDV